MPGGHCGRVQGWRERGGAAEAKRQTGRQDSPRAASADGRAPSSNGGSSSSSARFPVISPVEPGVGARPQGAGMDAAQGSVWQDPGRGRRAWVQPPSALSSGQRKRGA